MVNGLFRRMIRAATKQRRRRSAQTPPRGLIFSGFNDSDSPLHLETLEARLLMTMDPTASEQLMLELLNRMRMDPAGELPLLTSSLGVQATSSDADINAALDFFNVNGVTLAAQWSLLSAVPPLALE